MENLALVALEESALDMVAGGFKKKVKVDVDVKVDDIISVTIGDKNSFDASNGGTIIIGASDF